MYQAGAMNSERAPNRTKIDGCPLATAVQVEVGDRSQLLHLIGNPVSTQGETWMGICRMWGIASKKNKSWMTCRKSLFDVHNWSSGSIQGQDRQAPVYRSISLRHKQGQAVAQGLCMGLENMSK